MRDRTIRTRQAGSVVGSVCAGPSLFGYSCFYEIFFININLY